MVHVIKCGTCGYEAKYAADFHSCIDVLLQKLFEANDEITRWKSGFRGVHESRHRQFNEAQADKAKLSALREHFREAEVYRVFSFDLSNPSENAESAIEWYRKAREILEGE